jgi:hypothetical protein
MTTRLIYRLRIQDLLSKALRISPTRMKIATTTTRNNRHQTLNTTPTKTTPSATQKCNRFQQVKSLQHLPESILLAEPASSPVIAHTQTPPITPEQPLPSGKRTRDEDTNSDQSLSDFLAKGFQLIKDSDDVLLTQVHSLHAQYSALAKDLERAVKRQRLEHVGWTNAAKTVGKYTFAGVVGGIAIVVNRPLLQYHLHRLPKYRF